MNMKWYYWIIIAIAAVLFLSYAIGSTQTIVLPFQIAEIGQVYRPGDTFTKTFSLQNYGKYTVPNTTDPFVLRYVYVGYRVWDEGNNLFASKDNETIVGTVAPNGFTSYTVTLPIITSMPSGKYAVGIALYGVNMVWDDSCACYSQSPALILDQQGVRFMVATGQPTPSFNIVNFLTNLFARLWTWIRGVFGF